MRVDARFTNLPTPAAQGPRAPAGQRFTLDGRDATTGRTAAATSAAPLATVDALLALQGEQDPGERRRRSLKRGHDLLDALDHLKAALLSGQIAGAQLQQLAARLAERRDLSGDPRLDELLGHIELRAQVELAKLGRSSA